MIERPETGERAVIVQLDLGKGDYEDRLDEFTLLALSAGAVPVARAGGKRQAPDPATFAGKGKVAEIMQNDRLGGLDVLDAEQELLDARNARLEAEAQRYVGVYQVLSSMGLLTVDHLQLGIPTYDPEAYYNSVKSAPSTSVQGKKLDRILKSIGN